MNIEHVDISRDTHISFRITKIQDYPPHWHEHIVQIIYVIEGSIQIISNFENYYADTGDYILIKQGEIHHIHGDNSIILSFYIDLNYFEKYEKYLKYSYLSWKSFNLSSKQKKANDILKKIIMETFIEHSISMEANIKKINNNMIELIHILVNQFNIIHYSDTQKVSKENIERYHSIIKYIEMNYNRRIFMEDLAAEQYVGRNYISQFWKTFTKTNLTDFINSRRVELAEKLLLTSNDSIEKIAFKCGFSHPKYFYKCFKKWYLRTPKEHRKLYEDYYNKLPIKFEELNLNSYHSTINEVLTSYYVNEKLNSNIFNLDSINIIEDKIKKYTNVKIKKEMIKDKLRNNNIQNFCISIFDYSIVTINDSQCILDWNQINLMIQFVKDMHVNLIITINYNLRTHEKWEKILKTFMKQGKKYIDNNILQKIEYWVFFDDIEEVKEVKKLMDIINSPNIKISVKF